MKSRILAVFFAAMLAAGTLAGCGSKAAEDAEKAAEDAKKLLTNEEGTGSVDKVNAAAEKAVDAEVKADAQNSERVSKTYPKTEKYATNATAPKSEPQVSNEPEPTAHQTQFGNGEDSAALNKLKADLPQNTQAARQDNKVSYSRTTHRQTQPNA